MLLRTAALVVLSSMAWAAPARASHPPEYDKYYEESPTVELVTMGIGALIWERHGHIALCLRYHDARQDRCYNYGIAEFQKPASMAWGFLRGTRSFWVDDQSPRHMLGTYTYADRTVWVQPLPLTREQKQHVIAKLEHDDQDAHRYYAYDHFHDNCTTRVRDVIDDATGGALRSMDRPPGDKTFRELARDGFYGMRIPLLITDLAMGRSTDRVPTYWERMFLPQYLREAVHERWGIEPFVLYERRGPPPLEDGPSGRGLLALVILALTAPAWATRLWGRFERAGIALAVVPYVLLGAAFWFLALISPLDYVRWNETCLILLPTDVLLFAFLSPARRRRYARLRVGMLAVIAALNVASVIEAPLLAPILWPLIPALVVGFWPVRLPPARTEPVPRPGSSVRIERMASGQGGQGRASGQGRESGQGGAGGPSREGGQGVPSREGAPSRESGQGVPSREREQGGQRRESGPVGGRPGAGGGRSGTKPGGGGGGGGGGGKAGQGGRKSSKSGKRR